MSRMEIRKKAEDIRNRLHIPLNQLYIDVIKVLENIDFIVPGANFEIIPDNEFGLNVQAQTDVGKKEIFIKQSVYNGAAENNGRDRMTLAHEISHLLLHHPSVLTLYRRNKNYYSGKMYTNPEWQAECFGAELLMPYLKIKEMSEEEISKYCKVSKSAAYYQKKHI